jgi:hypothetical protein
MTIKGIGNEANDKKTNENQTNSNRTNAFKQILQ